MEDIILHHSSKSGISGTIRPISRKRCDFGQGFYLGTIEKQTQSLVLSDKYQNPIYYRMNLKLSEIPDDKILVLKDLEWAYFVIYNRGGLESIKGTSFYEYYQHLADNKDVIIGPIADDNMRSAILDFEENYITDVTLQKCLEFVDYGYQYVLKTDYACSKVEILESSFIKNNMNIREIKQFAEERRVNGQQIYNKIRQEMRREGKYLDEIIQSEKEKGEDHEIEM